MRVDDASTFFGSDAQLTRELKLKSQSALGNWRRRNGGLVPELYARRLADDYGEEKRNGIVLKFDKALYDERLAS